MVYGSEIEAFPACSRLNVANGNSVVFTEWPIHSPSLCPAHQSWGIPSVQYRICTLQSFCIFHLATVAMAKPSLNSEHEKTRMKTSVIDMQERYSELHQESEQYVFQIRYAIFGCSQMVNNHIHLHHLPTSAHQEYMLH